MRPVLVAVTLLVTTGFCIASSGTAVAGVDAGPEPLPQQSAANDTATNNTSDSSLGVSISSFMQGNAERTGETVDHGMWRIAFDDSDGPDRESLAAERVAELRQEVEEITAERRTLRQALENGTIDRATFAARMSALETRAESVTSAVHATSSTLERASVTAPGMSELATATKDVSSAAGGPPDGDDRPGDAPGPSVGTGDSGDRTGPPEGIWLQPPGNGNEPSRENDSDGPDLGLTPPGDNESERGDGPGTNPPDDNESDPIEGPGEPGTDPPEGNESDPGDDPDDQPPERNDSADDPALEPPDDNESDPVRDPDGNRTPDPPGMVPGDDSPENGTTTESGPEPRSTERLPSPDRAATGSDSADAAPARAHRFGGR